MTTFNFQAFFLKQVIALRWLQLCLAISPESYILTYIKRILNYEKDNLIILITASYTCYSPTRNAFAWWKLKRKRNNLLYYF
jgi:hypothetical protein